MLARSASGNIELTSCGRGRRPRSPSSCSGGSTRARHMKSPRQVTADAGVAAFAQASERVRSILSELGEGEVTKNGRDWQIGQIKRANGKPRALECLEVVVWEVVYADVAVLAAARVTAQTDTRAERSVACTCTAACSQGTPRRALKVTQPRALKVSCARSCGLAVKGDNANA
eukprot:6188056-Pleurochrysis_carterae.AAC.1